ncbi:hypothetical protein PENSUB_10178 [Penicillium subrubescens]|uniref:Uncharacterized protein n=1 Tax=Penicillium subrubescens TaxID=1316194 RepID=A0A1Q5TAV8_9EURO|nr:hypothetical protein PENSUB_10178 [Penicillium subrubescens]
MAEELARLTSEVERVVTAPYVPSLQYHPACIALLSSPLPPDFVPPARLAGFITKLVSAMSATPGAETIAPLYALMTGLKGSPNFINEVPTDVMSNLQLEFTKTLRNLDDHMGNLLGLATFAQISMSHRSQLSRHPGVYDESVVYELLRFTVDVLKDDSMGHDSMVNLHVSDLLLSGFQANLSQPMIQTLLSSASTKQAIASLFARFPLLPSQLQCQDAQVCYCACSALQNRVLLNLFEIYFAAALSHSGDTTDIAIMKSFVERTTKSFGKSDCTFARTEHNAYRSSMYLRNRQEFNSKRQPIRDWRSAITEFHMQNAETSHNLLMKKVDDICFDLERRCYDIEGPVRSAEEERDKHKYDAEQLRQQNEDLARQLNQSTQAVSTLQQDLTRLEKHAGLASARAEELSEALELSRQELRDQQHHSDDALRAEQEKARSRELELIATSTEKDDQLEELQESMRQLESQNQLLQQVVETSSHERATSAETNEALGHEISEVRNLLEAKTLFCCQKEDEVKRLLAENNDLQTELGSVQTIIDDQAREIEQLHATLQGVEEKAKTDMLIFNRDKEAEIAKLASEISTQKEVNGRLQKAMQTAASDAAKELQSKDKRIHQLEKKIQSLRDERAAKAREFSEAQQHIGRLMNVMGFSAKSNEKSSSKSQRSRDAIIAPTPSRRQSAVYDDDDDIQLAESFEYLASNLQGPTPKRPKGNGRSIHPLQAPAPKTPAAKNSVTSTNAPKTGLRQPLIEAGTNSPVKSQASLGSKGSQYDSASAGNMGENRLQDLDLDMDLEFSKDFLFTSTAFSPSNN